jgi:Nucleotidyl transferase AbiEii toxin, Type IV TA system
VTPRGLTRLQRRIARTVLRIGAPDGFHLAGGAALVAFRLIRRPTRDIDVLTALDTGVPAVARRVAHALRDDGLDVVVIANSPAFVRLEVIAEDARRGRFGVDLGRDRITWPGTTTSLGPTLSPRELAANKVLALAGRVQPRDLADVTALVEHVRLDDMLADAKLKDPGFMTRSLAEMVRMVVARPDAQWPVGVDVAAVRAFGLGLAKRLEG